MHNSGSRNAEKSLNKNIFHLPSFPLPLQPLVKKTAATRSYIKTCSFCQPDGSGNVGQVPSQICQLPSEPRTAPGCWAVGWEHLTKHSEVVAAFSGSIQMNQASFAGVEVFRAQSGAWPGLPNSLTCERQVNQFLFAARCCARSPSSSWCKYTED